MGETIIFHSNVNTTNSSEMQVQPRQKLVWRNVILFAYLHVAALYGMYLILTSAKIATTIFAIFMYQVSSIGITAGAHRLWSHRAYKAKMPLRIMLMIFNTIAFQNDVYEWARDHRLHHKYSETNADPHNAKRGFFFSHVGWLLRRKHPDIMKKGRGIDTSDLLADPVIVFQKKYYKFLMPIMCFFIPTLLPVYCWNETWNNSWFVATMFRYALSLNVTWLVNSAAHMWGGRPYDKYINPAENFAVAVLSLGEGWHNYHHVFPWDYKAAELGDYKLNVTTAFIDFFSKIGWAYDLKTVSIETVQKRIERTGVLNKQNNTNDLENKIGLPWGWDDKDLPQSDHESAIIINKQG